MGFQVGIIEGLPSNIDSCHVQERNARLTAVDKAGQQSYTDLVDDKTHAKAKKRHPVNCLTGYSRWVEH
jgi:hypothetical protein